QSFLVPLLWAGILAYVSWSPYQCCIGLFRGARTPAALAMTLLITLAVIVPMAAVVLLLRPEAVDVFRSAQAFLASGLRVPDFLLRVPLLGPHLAVGAVDQFAQRTVQQLLRPDGGAARQRGSQSVQA